MDAAEGARTIAVARLALGALFASTGPGRFLGLLSLALTLPLFGARPVAAQEPRPVSLSAASFDGPEGIEL